MRESEVLIWHSICKGIMLASASSLYSLFLTIMWMGGNYPKAMKQRG